MASKVTITCKSMLEDAIPGSTPCIIGAKCCKCHPQIAGWKYSEIGAKSPTRASVVGHADHRGDTIRDASQRT